MAESIIALHITDGSLAWQYRPARPDAQCDWDFGATANAGIDAGGNAAFLGEGSKDGTYYSLDPSTGTLRWKTNVVFGGFSGGFIATTAYDGQRVYGATAIGDFGRFESNGRRSAVSPPTRATRCRRNHRTLPSAPDGGAVAVAREPGRLVRAHHRGRAA